ncbi:Hypothetical predicted protein [Cloeon dipterum]|uniref:Bee-milk protein n=1 Tax=Cloeon dipterum TaxID=197152 RepID=A0A8S1D5A2_9INSE|nr:Hypothetical predicted protein [Cloeon dipterum]
MKPNNILPNFMAVFGKRIFLSLVDSGNISASLVSLPTDEEFFWPPKITPFPSWDFHKNEGCNTVQEAKGLEVDAVGRLWVLDSGNLNCPAKLWILNLTNDTPELVHQFSFHYRLHDLVLDETPDGWNAYITRGIEDQFFVFSSKTNKSWDADLPRMIWGAVALSPKNQPSRQLFLSTEESTALYSIPVAFLQNGNLTAKPELIGNWSEKPYKMLIDNTGTMYASFWTQSYISTWDISKPFQEKRFYEARAELNTWWAFSFALDSSSGTFWMTELNRTGGKYKQKILKAEIGAKSYIFDFQPTDVITTMKSNCSCSALIGFLAFITVLSGIAHVRQYQIIKKLQTLAVEPVVNYQVQHPAHQECVEPEMTELQLNFTLRIQQAMTPFSLVAILLCLSVASAVNFTSVYNWSDKNGMCYEWSSEGMKPNNILPNFMAVFGKRIFLSLVDSGDISASLISMPSDGECFWPPKITPFPSWDFHKNEGCNTIQEAKGLEVDAVGRLWVLDSGNLNCPAKLWILNLTNDTPELVHQFSFHYRLHDLVLDETPDGWNAYITRGTEYQLFVFSSKTNKSWVADLPRMIWGAVALSPKNEPSRQLFLSTEESTALYSIPVAFLQNGNLTAKPELIGNWSEKPYKMLIDNTGTMYASFWTQSYISTWDISKPFQEKRFYEARELNTWWAFSFALDSSSGTFWMTELNRTGGKYKQKILKAEIGAKSYIFDFQPTGVTTTINSNSSYSALIGFLVFITVLSGIAHVWQYQIIKKLQKPAVVPVIYYTVNPRAVQQQNVAPQMLDVEVENVFYGIGTPSLRPRTPRMRED